VPIVMAFVLSMAFLLLLVKSVASDSE
jgi:hypothetical protein